ncbi:lauroyl-Kdo(2)-lipid IV(A) myristoyltransferase [Thorsellia kenyensis]|uniref:Lipid A biosynthesis acyltransferase n=1 Tax=Thorsellia kenyensis TaxID=1549888 RepID=A0ABV6C9M5_9GAMM
MQKIKEPTTTSKKEFIPMFKLAFLSPRYWGIWLAVLMMVFMACIPAKMRAPLLSWLGIKVGRLAKGARRRAQANLSYCFKTLSVEEREKIIDDMFAIAPQAMIMMVELSIKSPEAVLKRVDWFGYEIIEELIASKKNAIFMVPHGWAVDIPAMLFASKGHPMAAMFHNQRNQLVDYLWNYARRRFGGRMHARDDGIKPFIKSIKQQYWGYYLPDQDHGPEFSVFADFFDTYKATLPALGKLVKVTRAEVIPLFPSYCQKAHRLKINILPPLNNDLLVADEMTSALLMNRTVEELIKDNLSQYTWILKLLKTRKEGDGDPYEKN